MSLPNSRQHPSVRMRRGYRRSVRPLIRRNIKLDHWYWSEGHGKDGGVRQIGAPGGGVDVWKLKHQVGQVMTAPIGKVRFLRHHVDHRTRLWSTQFSLVDGSLDP